VEFKAEALRTILGNAVGTVAKAVTGYSLTPAGVITTPPDEITVAVVVGVTGSKKGRILLKAGFETARRFAEQMNAGEDCTPTDVYLSIAEFANMFSGRALTQVNNASESPALRLTPPALFVGRRLAIITPSVRSFQLYQVCECGGLTVEVGFEGMAL
jgi:CheY-specific phosphatase CheX